MAQVELTANLAHFFPDLGSGPHALPGATVAEVVRALEAAAPGFTFYVCDEAGRLRQHVNVFVDGEMIADRRRLGDAVGEGSRVFIAQALSGG